MTVDRGRWMQTCSGGRFYPLDPRPEEIHIYDIAAALSKMCRFGGHSTRFYSIAEHSVLMSRHIKTPFKKAALLHDASEAYIVDIISPLKAALPSYMPIEYNVMDKIAFKFGFIWPMQKEVKTLDRRILADEREQALVKTNESNKEWGAGKPAGIKLQFWNPEKAEAEFLSQFLRVY